MEKLKLNVKKTIFVGLAFAGIQIFWTTYNFIIPLMLNRTFGLSDSLRGFVMGLDNILALFMLPLFGTLSDRTNTKLGKRTPYILFGTLAAIVLFMGLPFAENAQLKKAEQLATEVTNSQLWEYTTASDKTALRQNRVALGVDLSNLSDEEIEDFLYQEFLLIERTKTEDGKEITNTDYNDFVQPSLRNYIYQNVTKKNPGALIIYLFVLLLLLIAMGVYRSPAVALMPDVTPEPLRSPANAIINLMGGIGTVLAMVVRMVLFSITANDYYSSYTSVFLAIDILMIIFLIMYLLTVNENKLLKERQETCEKFGIIEGIDTLTNKEKIRFRDLPWDKVKNFLLALIAIFFCTMGTEAINSSVSVYATDNLGFSASEASLVTMLGLVFSGLAFIPVGYMAFKLGRKKTIMIGFICIAVSLFFGYFVGRETRIWFIVSYFLMNFGAVIATVNTLPLVLENSDSNTVGKFTGFYYTATMLASSISPYLSGLFMERFQRRSMYMYGTICLIIAIIVLLLVKGLGEKKELKNLKEV